jgi:hypothetical protein
MLLELCGVRVRIACVVQASHHRPGGQRASDALSPTPVAAAAESDEATGDGGGGGDDKNERRSLINAEIGCECR